MVQQKQNIFKKTKRNSDLKYVAELDVDIVLGMPSKKCRYHGICKIEEYGSLHSNTLNVEVLNVKILFNQLGNLIILFYENNMSESIRKKHFSTAFFEIQEAVKLPKFASNQLGNSFNILPGKYPIDKQGETYKVTFY